MYPTFFLEIWQKINQFDAQRGSFRTSEISVALGDGKEYEPDGYSHGPDGQEITLKIPGIIVGYKETVSTLTIDIPAIGEKKHLSEDIDLGLQKMMLQSIERTSKTTAELSFALNTGERKEVSIHEVLMESTDLHSGELLWKDDICTMTITFDEELTQTELTAGWPSFLVSGDWVFILR